MTLRLLLGYSEGIGIVISPFIAEIAVQVYPDVAAPVVTAVFAPHPATGWKAGMVEFIPVGIDHRDKIELEIVNQVFYLIAGTVVFK